MTTMSAFLFCALVVSSLSLIPKQCSKVALHAWCSADLTESLAKVFLECERDFSFHERRCQVDKQGDYCGSFMDSLRKIEQARVACLNQSAAAFCSSKCSRLLLALKKDLGCCINEMLNTTITSMPHKDLFDYSIWKNCSVDVIPPKCPSSRLTKFPKPQVTRKCSDHEFFQKRYQIQSGNATVKALANETNPTAVRE